MEQEAGITGNRKRRRVASVCPIHQILSACVKGKRETVELRKYEVCLKGRMRKRGLEEECIPVLTPVFDLKLQSLLNGISNFPRKSIQKPLILELCLKLAIFKQPQCGPITRARP